MSLRGRRRRPDRRTTRCADEEGGPTDVRLAARAKKAACSAYDSPRGRRRRPARRTTRCADEEGGPTDVRLAARAKKAACSAYDSPRGRRRRPDRRTTRRAGEEGAVEQSDASGTFLKFFLPCRRLSSRRIRQESR